MAKKKSESAPAAKPAKKPAKASPMAGDAPSIDTNAAASAAAALIGNKSGLGAGSTGSKTESSAFKALKQQMSKPALGNAGDLLGSSFEQKKSNQPFSGGKQVGKNQTFGADVNRAGVPRRTGGG